MLPLWGFLKLFFNYFRLFDKNFYKKFGERLKIINFVTDIRKFFSCLFVKFVLYTAGFLGEGTLLIFYSFPNFMHLWFKTFLFGAVCGFFL